MGKLGKSNLAGKCSAGKHDIAVGQDNYYEKINDKWFRCSDLECFKSQGGSYDPNAKSFPQKKARTIEESLAFVKAFDDYAWKLANEKSLQLFPKHDYIVNHTPNGTLKQLEGKVQELDDWINRRAIAVESIYHTLAEVFNGK